MTLHLSEDCLDRWLLDFDDFRYDFLRHCQAVSKAAGYYFEFEGELLELAHTRWKAECDEWHRYKLQDSSALSHIKVGALLLFELSSVEWVRNIFEYEPNDKDDLIFTGTADEREEVRRDINAGRGTYLAFQFVIGLLNWFETARIDRNSEFCFRMTPDLEHDLMVYLLSTTREQMGLFLTLKALYARDPKSAA
jgi:hypothetical protein